MWWAATWTAPFVPDEEGHHHPAQHHHPAPPTHPPSAIPLPCFSLLAGALLLIQLQNGSEDIVGWAVLPLEELGAHHLTFRSPPLPLTAAEARAPNNGLEMWLQCTLSLGVTSSYASFLKQHPRADANSATPFAVEPRMSMKFLSSVSAEI